MANTVTISGTLYANGDTGEAAVCLKSLAWQRVSYSAWWRIFYGLQIDVSPLAINDTPPYSLR